MVPDSLREGFCVSLYLEAVGVFFVAPSPLSRGREWLRLQAFMERVSKAQNGICERALLTVI